MTRHLGAEGLRRGAARAAHRARPAAPSATAYTVLRVVGAAWLVVLGVQAWRASHRRVDAALDTAPAVAGGWWRTAVTGYVDEGAGEATGAGPSDDPLAVVDVRSTPIVVRTA